MNNSMRQIYREQVYLIQAGHRVRGDCINKNLKIYSLQDLYRNVKKSKKS